MHAVATLLVLLCALSSQAATYYVDSAAGDDSRAGTSPGSSWKSLGKVNAARFQPGDRILLKSGSAWTGQLAPASSGTAQKPIVVDRYGNGPRPRIDGAGQVEDAVRLYNVEGIELRNLEITNHGREPAVRCGVHIFLDNFGTAHHITVAGLYVHDVNGTNEMKENGGIIFRTQGDRKPSRFDGLLIERNIVWKVDRSAIAAQSYHWPRSRWNPSLNVVIRDNYVDDIGGDGIVPWVTDGVIVEHNIARRCNSRADSYNAAIWPWSADNSLFQLNEASDTRTTKDGQGFDSDYNSRNTIFQYNYSHENAGGFMLICSPGDRKPEENLGNIGTIVRYNVSRNDRARIFHVSAAEKSTVHDNVIYVGPGLDVQMLIVTDWSGWANGAVFRGNRFFVDGTARYGHQVDRAEDGTYTIGSGWGPAKGIVFEGNEYVGRHLDRPEDPTGKILPSAKPPAVNWESPRFDPAHPEGFEAFLQRHRRWLIRMMEAHFGAPLKTTR